MSCGLNLGLSGEVFLSLLGHKLRKMVSGGGGVAEVMDAIERTPYRFRERIDQGEYVRISRGQEEVFFFITIIKRLVTNKRNLCNYCKGLFFYFDGT